MAKKNTVLIRLVNKESGYFYVTRKNPKKLTKKLEFRKYDPYLRKHAIFREEKIK